MVSNEISRAIGRLIIGKPQGVALDDELSHFLKTGVVGGVTLFKDHARDLPQLLKLIDGIHSAGGADVLVTVDQEGGAVQRFDHVVSSLPSAMALAALQNPEMVKSVLDLAGEQLRLLGVNLVFSPVLDLATNPANPIICTRAFSDQIDRVVDLAKITADVYQKFGVLTVGKHFPGHGDTFEDSHAGLAVIKTPLDQLRKRELIPFVRALPFLPSCMVAHIWLPDLEPDPIPGSLSPKVVNGLLRQELGYDGVVMTDDMPGMKAITDNWGLEEAAIRAVDAGVDLLLMCGTNEQVRSVHSALLKAVDSGKLSQERIFQSVERLRKFTALFAGRYDASKKEASVRLERLHQSIEFGAMFLQQYSAHAICAVRGTPQRITEGEEWTVISPEHFRYSLDLQPYLQHSSVNFQKYSLNPEQGEIDRLVHQLEGRNCVLLTFRGMVFQGQVMLGRSLGKVAARKLAVACDTPFELAEFTDWDNQLALLDPSDQAIKALSLVLSGKEKVGGTLPVSLPGVAV